jgi:hypothetical protein
MDQRLRIRTLAFTDRSRIFHSALGRQMMTASRKYAATVASVAAAVLFFLCAPANAAANTPFDVLLGSWGGSGQYQLQDGTRVRIRCNGYYTGGGSHLGMTIRCTGEGSKLIEIRSQLSSSGGRIVGNWEERTYNAEGSASGSVTGDKISLQISGGVTGTMQVSYTSSHQRILIATQGVALKSVTIELTRT